VHDIAVIKVGGSCVAGSARAAAAAVVTIAGGCPFVLVHGHGPELRSLLARLEVERVPFTSASGVPSFFTTEDVAELSAFAAVRVREALVRELAAQGIHAAALPAFWRGMATGERKARIRYADGGVVRAFCGDFAGSVARIDRVLLESLVTESRQLVVSAVLRDADHRTLVVDADHLALEIGAALGVRRVVLLSDRALLADGETVPHATAQEIDGLLRHASGGMARKLRHIKRGLARGVDEVLLVGAAGPLEQGAPHGTRFSAH
jgi:acetylglutamate/LysW-gamma-L-alpha-aminoadipate kinase